MRKLVLLSSMVLLAACTQAPSCPEPVAATPPQQAAAAAAPAETTTPDGPLPLESPLPEGFVLPFAFHRMYDNSGKTDAGAPQRRVMVEFIGVDAGAAEAALVDALGEKGFAEQDRQRVDGQEHLTFAREDGAEVIVKIDPEPARVRTEDARGTLHLTWNSA